MEIKQFPVALIALSIFITFCMTFSAAAQDAEEPAAEFDFFRYDRWVGDDVIESGTQFFELKKGVQTFKFPSESGGELTFMVFTMNSQMSIRICSGKIIGSKHIRRAEPAYSQRKPRRASAGFSRPALWA